MPVPNLFRDAVGTKSMTVKTAEGMAGEQNKRQKIFCLSKQCGFCFVGLRAGLLSYRVKLGNIFL